MKILSTLVVVATLAAASSPALAEPRNPNTALVPVEQALADKVFEGLQSAAIDQGRREGVALSASERSIVDRNLPHR